MQDSSTAAAALTAATTAHVDAPAAATKIAIDSEAFLGLSADIRERKLSSISSPVIVTINESACASVWGHMTVKRTNAIGKGDGNGDDNEHTFGIWAAAPTKTSPVGHSE